MSKVKHVVKLRGVISTSTGVVVAKTHQANEVGEFHGDTPSGTTPFVASYFKLAGTKDEEGNYLELFLETPKGRYPMKFNQSAGIWQYTTPLGHKIHVSLKKVVGELRYWS